MTHTHTHTLGSDAVEWMLENFGADREEALGVCQLLLDHSYFLSVMPSQKSFLDQSYYKFQVLIPCHRQCFSVHCHETHNPL